MSGKDGLMIALAGKPPPLKGKDDLPDMGDDEGADMDEATVKKDTMSDFIDAVHAKDAAGACEAFGQLKDLFSDEGTEEEPSN